MNENQNFSPVSTNLYFQNRALYLHISRLLTSYVHCKDFLLVISSSQIQHIVADFFTVLYISQYPRPDMQARADFTSFSIVNFFLKSCPPRSISYSIHCLRKLSQTMLPWIRADISFIITPAHFPVIPSETFQSYHYIQ